MSYGDDPNLKIGALVDEYENLASVCEANESGKPDFHAIARELRTECEWTDRGAETVCELAQRYGAFVLRNALALATALDIEDGSEKI